MVEQRIKETIKKIDREAKKIHSSSMAFRFGYDYTFLASLVEDMGLSFPLREDLMQMIPDELLENVGIYIEDLDKLAKRGIDVFKEINFYCYLRNGNTSISAKDKSDILREYLLKEMPFAYQLYRDLYNEGHIAFSENDKNYGSAYLMPLIDEYYITLNRCSLNDLSDIETTIHELMHVYIAKLSSSYSWRNHHNIISGFSKESASMYSSLNFYDFCLNNHICVDDTLLNRNVSDYETLCRFKLIHYFYEMGVRREKELTISEGINYKFDEATKLDEDERVPFFQYHEDECSEESFNKFLYVTGAIEAYELLRQVREGKDSKQVLNDFVLRYQLSDVNPDLFNIDLTFMGNEIKKNQKMLEKKYPINGYSVSK